MEYRDYYRILDIDKNASAQEVQKAYRSLARKYHPDLNRDPGAEARFKEIGEAYEVLKDDEKRKKYDQFGMAWNTAQKTGAPPPGWEHIQWDFDSSGGRSADFGFGSGGFGSSGFSSFFEMLFGSPESGGGFRPGGPAGPFAGGFGGRRSSTGGPRQGQDLESRIVLSLEDLVHSGERRIDLSDPLLGERRSLAVSIPRGVRAGQKIRLAGQGAPGAGGRAGDLLLVVELRPHPRFSVHNDYDLETSLPVAPWEAALGGDSRIETLSGPVRFTLPPGSSSGRKIRLRGRGLPRPDGTTGDLYVIVNIVVPKQLTPEEEELFNKLRSISRFEAGGNVRTAAPSSSSRA